MDGLSKLGQLVGSPGASVGAVVARLKLVPSEAESKDLLGRIPLQHASWNQAPAPVVQLLLTAYPDGANAVCLSRCTALHYAAWGQAPASVVALLLAANPQAAQAHDLRGMLPLHLALENKAPIEAVRLLVEAFPSALVDRERRGLRPLHCAMQSKAAPDFLAQVMSLFASCKERGLLEEATPSAELLALQYSALRTRPQLAPLFAQIDSLFISSCSDGNRADSIVALADHGAALGARRGGKTCLMIAARDGHPAVVSKLLDLDADIEATSDSPPVAVTGFGGGIFLAYPATAHARAGANASDNKPGLTALFHACGAKRKDVVRLLLDRGANVEARTPIDRTTPLMFCCANRLVEIMPLLIERGAGIETRDQAGNTPLMHAVRAGHLDVVSLLAIAPHKARLEAFNTNLDNPLTLAFAERQALTRAASSLPASQRLNAENKARDDSLTMVKLLLDLGARVEGVLSSPRMVIFHHGQEPFPQYQSPLMKAAASGYFDLVSLFLSRGASLQTVDFQGKTVLFAACNHVRAAESAPGMFDFLVKKGADLEARDNQLNTVLLHACRTLSFHAVETLLGLGANIEAADASGRTPLLATFASIPRVFGPMLGDESQKIALILDALLTRRARVTAADEQGRQALHLAAYRDEMALCLRLIESGCDPEVPDARGVTALQGYGSLISGFGAPPAPAPGPAGGFGGGDGGGGGGGGGGWDDDGGEDEGGGAGGEDGDEGEGDGGGVQEFGANDNDDEDEDEDDELPALIEFSPTLKQQRVAQLVAAREAYLVNRREANWQRRRHFLSVLADCRFRPLTALRLLLEAERNELGPAEKLPSVPIGTPEQLRAYEMSLVFSEEGLVKRIAAFV